VILKPFVKIVKEYMQSIGSASGAGLGNKVRGEKVHNEASLC